jgi:alpha-galactosidase
MEIRACLQGVTMTHPIKATMAIAALISSAALGASVDPLAPTGRWSAYTSGQGALPPMGWNSWNAFGTKLDEEKVLGSARRIVESGLLAKGYRYVNLDDGWWLKRRLSDGRIQIRPEKFPSSRIAPGESSFRPLTDRLHAMGLKAGIYTDLGRNLCSQAYDPRDTNLPVGTVEEREVGIYGHIDQDIRLFFQDWGFDYLKVDGCGVRAFAAGSEQVKSGDYRILAPIIDQQLTTRSNITAVQSMFRDINTALVRYNPDGDFLLSLCIWGSANVRAWAKDYGNASRTSDDISPRWSRLLTNFDTASHRALYAHPGSWNDPDMLNIGAGEFDADHLTEARSHFALWAILNAPLIIGTDLRTTSKALMEVFGNADIIAINQDKAGNQATMAFDSDDAQTLVKTLASGEKAVAVLNRTDRPLDAILTAEQLKYLDTADVETVELWTGKRDHFRKETKFTLAAHETMILRVRGARQVADGLYLSEQPGSVNPAVEGLTRLQPDPTIHRGVASWRGMHGSGDRPLYAGWGGAQTDSTPYGQALQIGGKLFASGIGILAGSRLEVRNNGFTKFTTQVGIDDSATDKSQSVSFSIYGDGKLLARSAAVHWGGSPVPLTANVAGVRIVELVAKASGKDTDALPVTWGDAMLRGQRP